MASFLSSLPLPFLKKPTSAEDEATKKEAENKAILKQFSQGLVTTQDIIAPEAIEVDFTYQKINSTYTRTLFVAGYPRTVPSNWLSPLINYPHQLDISMFIFPVDVREVLENLKRKITEMEAEITSDIRQGKISNIDTEVKLEDARVIREQLAKGAERFYQFGLYVTIQAKDKEELDRVTKAVQSTLGSLLIVSKKATLQMDQGFKTTLPMGVDQLLITRNMDTTALATTFPFTSSELTMDTGIVYGINEHNDSLVVFDRYKMESFNMLIFAKSGAGKSYTVKLEILRQMMFDTEVLVLDPEHEYEDLAKAVGGEYINFSFNSPVKINPFDLSNIYEEGENELGQKIISLHALLKVMLGEMTATQDAMIDRALVAAYKAKGITPDPATQTNEPPLMEDLYKALIGMENAEANDIAARLEKFITGSFRGIFDQKSNLNIKNQLTVFSVKDMEEELRPIAMFVILDFIWTRVKKKLKKRLLVVDEAWYFMRYPDAAYFMQSIAKRARKYYLALTTITQDVEDFMTNEFGKAIVSNAAIKFLMKQSPSSIPILAETFYLSEGEKQLLVSADVGEGIFFAGQNHVALRVVASPEEHEVITTNPEEVLTKRTNEALAQLPDTRRKSSLPATLNTASLRESLFPSQKNEPVQAESPSDVATSALQEEGPVTETSPPPSEEQESQPQAAATEPVSAETLPVPTPPPGTPQPQRSFSQAGNFSKPPSPQSFAGEYTIDDYTPPTNVNGAK
ncbi:ATP-binding protein [Patescibacteria group bacterium]|nr:ATP-binding protein [Patescibacteria group bacterium]